MNLLVKDEEKVTLFLSSVHEYWDLEDFYYQYILQPQIKESKKKKKKRVVKSIPPSNGTKPALQFTLDLN